MKLGFFSSIITDGNPTSGYEIANEAIVGGLRELGHEVSVIGFQLPRQAQRFENDVHVLDVLNLENSEARTIKKIEWLARAKIFGLPVAAAKLTSYSKRELELVLDRLGHFDGYIINSYQMASAFPFLVQTPYVYVAHNVEHRSAQENSANASTAIERYFYSRDERLLKNLERSLCEKSRHVWTLSEDDLTSHKIASTDGDMLPLITPKADGRIATTEKKWDVGLIGTWSWQPNLVGLQWFLKEIVPQLPGEYRIAIAGSTPNGLTSDHPGVRFLGRVESASEFLESVRVIPLVSRGGTGVQLKTIEAFQAGYSCVVTSSSVRGIDKLPANCLRADGAEDYGRSLITLVENNLNGSLQDVSGNQFYQAQKAAMLRVLDQGVKKLA